MPAYTAVFRTDTEYALRTFKARSPQGALRKAQAFYKERSEELLFQSYAGGDPVNQIAVYHGSGGVTLWQDDDVRVRLAAHDLLDAGEFALRELRGVYSDRESEAVRVLAEAIAKANGTRP